MNNPLVHYAKLADLFSYPDAQYSAVVGKIQSFLEETCTEASHELKGFTEFASQASLVELEELYTRSFDVQAVTTIDLGYVLFGDDYKRGELLVNLSREHSQAGVDCGTELPDHLPNMLRLLATMKQSDLRDELVQKIVAPALRRIIAEFDPARLDNKNKVFKKHYKTLIDRSEEYGVIYAKPLRALYTVLSRDFNVDPVEKSPLPQQSCFLSSIGTELTMDCDKGNCHGPT